MQQGVALWKCAVGTKRDLPYRKGNMMIDHVLASRIARMEYEERVRAVLREEQMLNDILPDEYDSFVTRIASQGHMPSVGDLLSSVRRSLVSLETRLKHTSEAPLREPMSGQKRRTMVG